MRILVDADACPVKNIILDIAKEKKIDVIMIFDTSHEYSDDYSQVIFVDKGPDSADYKLISLLKKEDIVITQDYGLSSMALTKTDYVIHINGFIINKNNIDSLLNSRYLGQVARRSNKHIKGPKKRNNDNNEAFYLCLKKMIEDNE